VNVLIAEYCIRNIRIYVYHPFRFLMGKTHSIPDQTMPQPIDVCLESAKRSVGIASLLLAALIVLIGCKKEEEILLSCTGTETTTQITPQRGQETVRIERSFRFFEATREVTEFDTVVNIRAGTTQGERPIRQRVWVFQVDNSPERYRTTASTEFINAPYPGRRTEKTTITVTENELAVFYEWNSTFNERRETLYLNINRLTGSFDSRIVEQTTLGRERSHFVVTASGICTRLTNRRI
jgi:hypothetical protein